MKIAKPAKPARTAKAAKPVIPAKAAKPAKAATAARTAGLMLLAFVGALLSDGCMVRNVSAPLGQVSPTTGEAVTIGNYNQWTCAFWAKEAYEDKGVSASLPDGYASNGQTASSDTTASVQLLQAMLPLLAAAYTGRPAAVARPGADSEAEVEAPAAAQKAPLPAERSVAADSGLSVKMAEAKKSGKPLVVIAGNEGCGFCSKLDRLIDADAAFLARTDIILHRETAPWDKNAAAKWTGGGKLPVLRVTQWDADGSTVCDKKVNRPQSVAEIEAALQTCEAPE